MEKSDSGGFRLTLLGGFGLKDRDGRAVALPTRKCELLLAYLAMPAGQFHSRDKLAGLLWSDSGAEQASGSLRKALSALRLALGAGSLLQDRDAVALAAGMLTADAELLAARVGLVPLSAEIEHLAFGEFLDGKPSTSPEFADWLSFERTRCRNHAQAVFGAQAAALLGRGQHAEALAVARRLIALDTLREESHRLVMRIQLSAGERPAALAHFKELQVLLRHELGVEPSPATLALKREIAAGKQAEDVGSQPPTAAHRLTVAVLPFVNNSGASDQDAFAYGLSEDIITELSRRRDLLVIARQSSFQFAGDPAAVAAAALGVRYVLSGGLRRAGGRLRITAQLTDAAGGRLVWAERYDRPAEDIFDIQDEVVSRIIAHVDAELRHAERERAARKHPDSLDAWEAFHRGLWHMYRFTREDTQAAEAQFRKASALSPEFALPHAGLGYAAFVSVTWHYTTDVATGVRRGLADAERAIARDAADAFSHVVLGRLLTLAGDLDRATHHLALAIELNPSFAQAHFGLAQASFWSGEPAQALAQLDRALRLNPKDPLASMFMTLRSFCHFWLDQLDQAEASARQAINLEARETWSRLALAAALIERGRPAEAAATVAEARAIDPALTIASFDAIVGKVPAPLRARVYVALAAAGLSSG